MMKSGFMVTTLLLVPPVIALAGDDRYREFDDPHLQSGRKVWLDNCEGCHGWGVGGAPVPMNYPEWEPRIAQGMETLYQHAIEGFFGPDDTMMPERGGNPELSNEEIRSAVDYAVELAKSHKP